MFQNGKSLLCFIEIINCVFIAWKKKTQVIEHNGHSKSEG